MNSFPDIFKQIILVISICTLLAVVVCGFPLGLLIEMLKHQIATAQSTIIEASKDENQMQPSPDTIEESEIQNGGSVNEKDLPDIKEDNGLNQTDMRELLIYKLKMEEISPMEKHIDKLSYDIDHINKELERMYDLITFMFVIAYTIMFGLFAYTLTVISLLREKRRPKSETEVFEGPPGMKRSKENRIQTEEGGNSQKG